MVCEKGTHRQSSLVGQILLSESLACETMGREPYKFAKRAREGSRLFSSLSTFNHKRATMHVDSNLNQLTEFDNK